MGGFKMIVTAGLYQNFGGAATNLKMRNFQKGAGRHKACEGET